MENVRRASLYDCIGVAPDATRETIEHACRQAAERYRAGKDSGDPVATRSFAEIKMAYKTLTDPSQRAAYDSSLAGIRPARLVAGRRRRPPRHPRPQPVTRLNSAPRRPSTSASGS